MSSKAAIATNGKEVTGAEGQFGWFEHGISATPKGRPRALDKEMLVSSANKASKERWQLAAFLVSETAAAARSLSLSA